MKKIDGSDAGRVLFPMRSSPFVEFEHTFKLFFRQNVCQNKHFI